MYVNGLSQLRQPPFLVIHVITTQIIVKLFAVVLLFLLNMGESVTENGA